MKRIFAVFIFICTTLSSANVQAAWLQDYEGTIGNNKIGLTLIKKSPRADDDNRFINAHYFYSQYLIDIPLKIKSQDGRNLILEELDKNGDLVAIFTLYFEKKDPRSKEESKHDLDTDVLTGTWQNIKNGDKLEVYLNMHQGVSGDGDGGRCGLTLDDYKKLEGRVKKFHAAILSKDTQTLKSEFNYQMPVTDKTVELFSRIIPHALFCNYQGFMIGRGITWFDETGQIITNNH